MADTLPVPSPDSAPPPVVAVVVAAGSGSRIGGQPKQFRTVGGAPVLRLAVQALRNHDRVGTIIVAVAADRHEDASRLLSGIDGVTTVTGGASRQDSVSAGLAALGTCAPESIVLIHDAARPHCPADVIDRLLAAHGDHDGAVPVLPVVDTLATGDRRLQGFHDRSTAWRVQTPQAFRLAAIRAAHAGWQGPEPATDDASVAQEAGLSIALVPGDERLAKITFAEDLMPAPSPISGPAFRIGQGHDVHRLVVGEQLWLCGISVPHSHGLSGHSDADVALHALADAILGAAALGDIGQHFPPSDARWRGAPSDQFAAHAVALAAEAGWRIANVDITIICEAPRIGPHRDAMRARVAEILAVPVGRVSVKATTTERLGFTGRGEGIEAQAIVLLTGCGHEA